MKSVAALCPLMVAAALCMPAGDACAQGKPLSDDELSQTWGQALFDLTNTSQEGYDFSRLTLNADIMLSTSMTGIQLGHYTYAARNAGGYDIDIPVLNFGRSDLADADRKVSITNPYFEWVYSNDADPANRQVVGMRMGFGGISGNVGLQMNVVSGSLVITTPTGTVNSANDTLLNGKRWNGTDNCTTSCTALSQIGALVAGNASGPSRDFFLSILKTALTWPTTDPTLGVPAQSQAGFWLNWTDRLAALNTTGVVPPNVPKIGP